MQPVPCLPENAPFTPEQRAWVNGFLAGLFSNANATASSQSKQEPTPPQKLRPLLIGFGSQTGAAQSLAKRIAREAGQHGFEPTLKELNAIPLTDLAPTTPFVLVTSTWGDGDPPDNATAFFTQLSSTTAPRLDSLPFAVLALGDRNYSDFCGAGRKFDARLEQLGAHRLLARADCDVDYEPVAKVWIHSLWTALSTFAPSAATPSPPTASQPAVSTPPAPQIELEPTTASSSSVAYSRASPFAARLKTNRRLNQPGSQKDTRHFEIALDNSGLVYEVGDALGVWPANCPALVEELLAALGFSGDETVPGPNVSTVAIHQLLSTQYSITTPTSSLVREAALRSQQPHLLQLLEPNRKSDWDAWKYGRDVVDVLRACPGAVFTPSEFLACLSKLQPRLYSISSSPKRHPNEVHLTVAAVRYESHGRSKKGVCSCWLADRVIPFQTPVPVFVQSSHGFRLPPQPGVPIIMVGPGTGIAPFRAFLEERQATGDPGQNWLFFGDQQRALDFLYQEELEAWSKDGHLARLDLAFSRDQDQKIYVQHRLLEQAAELWRWLENGAHFYVCGDAKRMARDVDAALATVIETAGGRTPSQARDYIDALKSAKRYQRDVY